MRRFVMASTIASLALFNLPAVAQTNMQVAEQVIAITKAQWAAEIAKQPAATQMKNVADEYTVFVPGAPTRTDGKSLNMRLVEADASGGSRLVAAEMANEKVQVYGDVVILSYNFIGRVKNGDGEVENSFAKSTRVYVNKGGNWMLVHANFAPLTDD
jgi:ketosteroid isomerase-like protein